MRQAPKALSVVFERGQVGVSGEPIASVLPVWIASVGYYRRARKVVNLCQEKFLLWKMKCTPGRG